MEIPSRYLPYESKKKDSEYYNSRTFKNIPYYYYIPMSIFDIEKGLYFGRKNSFSENLNIFINGFISNEEEEINWSIEKI